MKKTLLLALIVAQMWISAAVFSTPIRFRVRTIDPDGPQAQAAQGAQPARDKGLFALQCKGPILPEWRSQIEALGVAILGYIPENTLVVRLGPGQLGKVRSLPFVHWMSHLSADLKVEPNLLSRQRAYVDVILRLVSPDSAPSVSALLQSYGAIAVSRPDASNSLLTATVLKSSLLAIADNDNVEWVEEWVQPKTTNDVAQGITQVTQMRQRFGLYGAGQIVGVADTGLDTGSILTIHPDFRDRVLKTYALRRENDWSDLVGHGTHVTGTIAGSGAQSGSQPSIHNYTGSFAGVAPEASIVMQSIGDGTGSVYPPLDLDQLFLPAYNDGVRVHNDSWGSPAAGQYTVYAQQVDEFVWAHKDFVVVFPVGNDGVDRSPADGVTDVTSIYTPATAKNCISVGATESNRNTGRVTTYGAAWSSDFYHAPIYLDYISNNPGGMVAWSGRGPCADGRIKPDICAPGTNIISARSQAVMNEGWAVYNSDYVYWGGTSMSTPMITGAAAIVREYCIKNKSIMPSAALVKAMLMNGATELFPGQYGTETSSTREIRTRRPDRSEGWGRLNLSSCFDPPAPCVVDFIDETSGINAPDERVYQYSVLDNSLPLAVTLAWTDYPGEPLASQELVNDLDLTVVEPNGITKHYGNGASRDSINNVETVDIAAPIAGTYTVKVKGYNVPFGPQPFALVISGKLPGAYIAGHLHTATGKPIAGATITITSGAIVRTISTDGNGSYTVHLSPGTYTVTPSKTLWQFSPISLPITVTDVGVDNVDFTGTATAGGISGTITRAVGGVTNYVIESPHPYDDNCNLLYTIQAHPSATHIRVHFSDLYVQDGNDFVTLSNSDGTVTQDISGGFSDLWSDWFDGNAVTIRLTSDDAYTDWGFYVDGYETDVVTEGGVEGVTVTAQPYSITAISQSSGQYTLSNLEPVSYDLSLAKQHWSFSPASASVSVPPGPGGVPGITLPGIDFLGFPPAAVSGRTMTGDIHNLACSSASQHPYLDDWTQSWTISYTGTQPCSRIRVHFSRIDTERDYDFAFVKTPAGDVVNAFTGGYPDGVWSSWVPGNELQIVMQSDQSYGQSNEYWGFATDSYMIAGNERPLPRAQIELDSGAQGATTDTSGNYVISDVNSGIRYRVTPKKLYYEIEPSVQYVNAVSGVTCSDIDFFATPQEIPSPGSAKVLTDGETVMLSGLTVTAGSPRYPDFFYVESASRTSGIRVSKALHGLLVGSKVDVSGTIQTLESGERFIAEPTITPAGTGGVSPMGINNVHLGGGNWVYDSESGAGQIGIAGSSGLNNIGMLVTVWGKVTLSVPSSCFYVDDGSGVSDGSGTLGIYVDATGLDVPSFGSYVVVTGVSSCESYLGKIVNTLLPRSQSDISVKTLNSSVEGIAQLGLGYNPRKHP
jgi:subtilisin family serine protease